MNFFEHQAQAQKNTRWLLLLFLIAVLAIVGLLDVLFLFILVLNDSNHYLSIQDIPASFHIQVALSVIVVVAAASIYRLFSLRAGGRQVAEEMGARLIVSSTTNSDERRLLNVVEEMAIASGFPVPQVYVINNTAINAFAAGYTPHDAVVAVTKGLLERLNREELQGVIAHEFSHILNGDMRLNLRLIGILFGILFIGLIGRKIIRGVFEAGEKEGLPLAAVGVALVTIGYSGLFCGNMIKATISRQREYLADASAVQFTRNPAGFSNALKKIGGSVLGTNFNRYGAEEYSHLYFMSGVDAPFFGLFDTHPPLPDRIRRIEPSWDGQFIKEKVKPQPKQPRQDQAVIQRKAAVVTAAAVMDAIMTIGMPTQDHVNYAHGLMKEIPESLLHATRTPLGAYGLVLGLMMQPQMLRSITAQDEVLKDADRTIRQALRQVTSRLMALDIKYRLPLIELSMPALKTMSEQQLAQFNQDVLAIIRYDGYVDVWEWALHYWITTLSLGRPDIPQSIYKDFSNLKLECSILLTALSCASATKPDTDEEAFTKAEIELGISLERMSEADLDSDLLIDAVEKVRHLYPLVKPKFLNALCLVAQHDGLVEAREIELIRTIAEGIGCPMPPVLDMETHPSIS